MKKKILFFSVIITVSGLLLMTVLAALIFRSNMADSYENILRVYMKSYETHADSYVNFDITEAKALALESDSRVTFMDLEGNVLADSEATETLENHFDRTEVVKASRLGEGFAVRSSQTLNKDLMYFCKKFAARGVYVRMAVPLSSVWGIVVDMLPVLSLILVLDIALCIVLTFFAVRHVLKPVEEYASKARGHSGISAPYPELVSLADTLSGMKQDASKREEVLREEMVRNRVILDSMEDGLIILKSPKRVLLVNKSAATLFDYNEKDKFAYGLASDRILSDIIANKSGGTVERTYEDKIFLVHVTYTYELDASVILVTDVTQIRYAQMTKNEFIRNVTHEMNTPLTSISGFSELLASGKIKKGKEKETAQIINRESIRLNGLVKSILDYSALEGDVEPDTDLDLGHKVTQALTRIESAIKLKNITLDINIEKGVNVRASIKKLDMLIDNLLSNAVKYNSDGGKIGVVVSNERGVPELKVSDTGIGIDKAHYKRIFDRFYTVDESHGGKGYGLGLAIVKRIAEKYKWRISVESVKDKGTEFSVVFNR